MIKNYFFLNRFIIEADNILPGKSIKSIFSQEKDKIIFELIANTEIKFLEISVNPGDPFINVRQNYSRAKKNTVNFFPQLIGAQIKAVEIADDDRIIRITTEKGRLYFTVRGKLTNVLLISSENEVSAFKKINEDEIEKLKSELTAKKYTDKFNLPNVSIESKFDYLDEIRKKFPVISKESVLEVKRRLNSTRNDEQTRLLREVILEIKNKKPAVFIDELQNKISLGVESYKIFADQKKEIFEDLISAQNYFLSKKYFLEEKGAKLTLISKHIENELKKITSKINNLKANVEKGSREEEFNKIGNLLLINLAKIKPGIENILLEDVYSTGKKIEVKLNKKLSPKKNAESYFEKSKSERVNFQKSVELLKLSEAKFKKLKELESNLVNINDLKGFKIIMKDLKMSDKSEEKTKDDLGSKFKQYIIEGKYKVYVGKDSKNNDQLTTKFAKQNDYWFHARGVSGSHVVLRIENTKESVPKNILKKTASIAAFHSKAKTAGIVPVAYTFKKYVVKKKGDPTGTVHLLREDVLLVVPVIPNGCEFVSSQE
jgi:predicted ribosome quality control (RQC) complex YloA/Tae2 family protein